MESGHAPVQVQISEFQNRQNDSQERWAKRTKNSALTLLSPLSRRLPPLVTNCPLCGSTQFQPPWETSDPIHWDCFSPLILFRPKNQRGGGPHTICPSPAQWHLHNVELLLAVAFQIQRTLQAFAGQVPGGLNPLGQPGSFKAFSVFVHYLQNIISRAGAWLLQK